MFKKKPNRVIAEILSLKDTIACAKNTIDRCSDKINEIAKSPDSFNRKEICGEILKLCIKIERENVELKRASLDRFHTPVFSDEIPLSRIVEKLLDELLEKLESDN